jgi:poly(A) polymerase
MEIGEWWTTFADAKTEQRTAMLLPDTALKRKRRRKLKKKPAPTDNGSA